MKIVIGYLYYDLLNLYGENGNIKILKKQLENQGIEVIINFLSIDDDLKFDKYDFVYIGAGTENNQEIAIKHLITYKKELKKYIDDNKFILATGNAIELFGKKIKNKKSIKALSLFNYETKKEIFKMSDDCLFKSDLFDEPFIGFQNQFGVIKKIKEPWFKVINGVGSYPKSTTEGIHYKNFYGTYLIGPLLVRNPHFTEHLIKELILNKKKKFKFKEFDLELEKKSYKEYLQNLYSNKL